MSDALPLKYADHALAATLPNPFDRDLLRLDRLREVEPFLGNLSPLQPCSPLKAARAGGAMATPA